MFLKPMIVSKNFQTRLLIGWRLPASQSRARFENFCWSTWILMLDVLSEKILLMQTGSESLRLMPRLLCNQGISTHNNEHTAQTDHYLPSVWKSSTFDHSLTKKKMSMNLYLYLASNNATQHVKDPTMIIEHRNRPALFEIWIIERGCW